MFDKFLFIVFPNSESLFVFYILPAIISFIGIICIWIITILLFQFIKLKEKKWHEAKAKMYLPRFFIAQKSLIRKSLISIRYILSIYIVILLLSHTLKTFLLQIKDSLANGTLEKIKMWNAIALYSKYTATFLDKISEVMLNIFLTVLIAIWCIRILQKATDVFIYKANKHGFKNIRGVAKKNTLNSVTNQFLRVIISIIALFTILQNLGINIAALLATAGLASVAIGFGAQNLVKDFIAGFFILFEDQFAVGDVVDLNSSTSGSFSGAIEKMTLRMVRIRSNEGSLLTIPNGDIKSVKNYTTDWSRIDFKYSLEIKSNLEKAATIFKEEVERLCQDFPKEIIAAPDIRTMEKIVDFENRSVATTFRVFLKTINTTERVKIEMEFNRRLLIRFKAEDVYLLK